MVVIVTKIYKQPIPEIPGWMSENDLDWLYSMAKEMNSIVEIGSWKGRSTHALCSGCKGFVYAIDHFQGSKGAQGTREHYEKPGEVYDAFLKNVGHFKNLKILKMSNLEAVKQFEDKSVDMVFIDGGHSYEEVKIDIEAWLPKTRKLLSGHDYSVQWPSVKKAVNEKFKNINVVDAIWYKKYNYHGKRIL